MNQREKLKVKERVVVVKKPTNKPTEKPKEKK